MNGNITKEGITALQMDIKVRELSRDILEKALEQAKAGRLHILEKIQETIDAPRNQMSEYAPSILSVTINPEKIGEVIGPGGKNIRALQMETNTQIEIDDSVLHEFNVGYKALNSMACVIHDHIKKLDTHPPIEMRGNVSIPQHLQLNKTIGRFFLN